MISLLTAAEHLANEHILHHLDLVLRGHVLLNVQVDLTYNNMTEHMAAGCVDKHLGKVRVVVDKL